jgi:SEC-C motif-containing protein
MKMPDQEMLCPCSSGAVYGQCCHPFHQGDLPDTALQLMRSSYSAYALNLPDYIIKTTHPDHKDFHKDRSAWRQKITRFSRSYRFERLEILDFKEMGEEATVTFTAHLFSEGRDGSFTERSEFTRVDQQWLYRQGAILSEPAS